MVNGALSGLPSHSLLADQTDWMFRIEPMTAGSSTSQGGHGHLEKQKKAGAVTLRWVHRRQGGVAWVLGYAGVRCG